MPDTKRQTKTAAEKAREALGVAGRKLKRLEDEKSKHQAAINVLVPQIADAKATRDYLQQHPALQAPDAFTRATGSLTTDHGTPLTNDPTSSGQPQTVPGVGA